MDDLLAQFLVEARELLEQAADDLLAFESEPGDLARLDSAYRAFHTLKGSAGLFDLMPLQASLHAAEDVLGAIRAGSADSDGNVVDPLLAILAWTERCVDSLETTGALPEAAAAEAAALVAALPGRTETTPRSVTSPRVSAAAAPASPPWALALLARHRGKLGEAGPLVALRYQPHPECFFNGDDPLALVGKVGGVLALELTPRQPWPEPAVLDPYRANLVIDAIVADTAAAVQAAFRLLPDQAEIVPLRAGQTLDDAPGPAPMAAAEGAPSSDNKTLRVDAARVDGLVALIGEIVAAKNVLPLLVEQARSQTGAQQLTRNLASAYGALDRLVSQMHRAVMAVRMVPLEQTLRRLPRLVRKIAAELGKTVDLTISGARLEADKTIVDELYEPLLHIVRNAIDHGIEPPEERQNAGKPARGALSVRASQLGEHLLLEVVDDGRGVDAQKVGAAATARGLIPAGRNIDAADAAELLFAPGFSTADAVTNVSGRGVGLDAVRNAAVRLGGSADLDSRPGHGTTVRLVVPVSFSLLRLIVVEAGGERYGVSMDDITETVSLPHSSIVAVRAGEAFVLRDRTIPLLRLSRLLDLVAGPFAPELRVLIVDAGGTAVGIAVDAIAERAETLLRPLPLLLRGLAGLAGTTLLGDGSIIMVLDLKALAQ